MSYQVFVYGTLRKGCANHRLLRDGEFVGKSELTGYEMWGLGSYPGITVSDNPESVVEAELYTVSDETLLILDKLEDFYGVNHPQNLYDRVLVEDHKNRKGWVYVFRKRLLSLPHFRKRARKIESGVWPAKSLRS